MNIAGERVDAADLIALPINKKIGQLFIIGVPGPLLDEETASLLDDVSPGGVCLFSRNIREARQTRKLLDNIRERLSVPPILALDQEGGLVDRLRRIIEPMPAPGNVTSAADAAELGAIVAETVRMLGFNLDFAPVVDVVHADRQSSSNGLFSRSFGSTSDEAVEFAKAFLDALNNGGCAGCVKHFPGLGASTVDSHEELPIVDIPQNELFAIDIPPFERLIGFGATSVMVAHAAYPKTDLQEIDQNGKLLPSSLSYNFVTGLLRNTLGFSGLVFTDDLEMGAIVNNYGIADACVRALGAGNDVLAICADPMRIREGYTAVSDALQSGALTEERIDRSLERIAAAKSALFAPIDLDESKLASLSTRIQNLKERCN